MTTETTVRDALLATLCEIAPEADLSRLGPRDNLREQLDLDSMDFLNVVTALHERLGVDVPERDYAELSTLERAVAYLTPRAAEKPSSESMR